MFEPPRISPEAASARSFSAAARPLPRSRSVKHFDCETNTLISASGESSWYCSHHLFSGSVTASVPIFLSQVGICGGGGSAARTAAAAPRLPTRHVMTESFSVLYGSMDASLPRIEPLLCPLVPAAGRRATLRFYLLV